MYPQLQRLDIKGVKYAKSAFNVWIDHEGQGRSIEIDLHSEANGNEIRYTLDGTDPDTTQSFSYSKPFAIDESCLLKAAAFKDGKIVSEITEKRFLLHHAAQALVTVNQDGKTSSTKSLTDLNYGINWSVDTTWQRFNGKVVELIVDLPGPTKTNSLIMNFLQVAISGIYMPETIQVSGSENGKTYFDLGEIIFTETS